MPESPSEPPHEPMVVQSRAIDPSRNPDVDHVMSITLRDGPKRRRTAKYDSIRDRNTQEFHHDSITIQTIRFKGDDWQVDEKNTVSISSEDGVDEIQTLVDFIAASRGKALPRETGRFVVAQAPEAADDTALLQDILTNLQSGGNYNVFADVLRQVGQDGRLLEVLIERAARHPQLFVEAAAALNCANYHAAIDRLVALIADPESSEHNFQSLLADNPWMFGSEFSQLLPRRRWTRDENLDFVLRRTTDGFLEIVEIKTPLTSPLFRLDQSHNSYYPGVELSKVLGQVQKYLEALDADQYAISKNDREEVSKVRAKIIIGRDYNADQVSALRRLNGHLHRIEIITYDQLVNIAHRVVGYLDQTLHPTAER